MLLACRVSPYGSFEVEKGKKKFIKTAQWQFSQRLSGCGSALLPSSSSEKQSEVFNNKRGVGSPELSTVLGQAVNENNNYEPKNDIVELQVMPAVCILQVIL